jgi:hypothetical protein
MESDPWIWRSSAMQASMCDRRPVPPGGRRAGREAAAAESLRGGQKRATHFILAGWEKWDASLIREGALPRLRSRQQSHLSVGIEHWDGRHD